MDLDELKKRLYAKDAQITDRPHSPEEFEPGKTHLNPNGEKAAPVWQEENAAPTSRLTKKMLLGAGAAVLFLALAGLAAWYFFSASAAFDKNKIYLEIFGPKTITAGEEQTYIVKYRNNTKVALNNFTLTFDYPDQAIPSDNQATTAKDRHQRAIVNLKQLNAKTEGQQEFKVKVWGEKDSVQTFSARIDYQPVNYNSQFSNETDFKSIIQYSPLVLNFNLPQKLSSGQELNFSLQYINTADTAFDDLEIKLEYPDGFVFKSALPGPASDSRNDVWPISHLAGRAEGKIIINGTISGQQNESKTFAAMLGIEQNGQFVVYDKINASPEIIASPLAVYQSSDAQNNRVDLDQQINYKIKYKNTTNEAIGPVIIKVKIDSPAVDLARISADRGFFSAAENALIWNAGSLANLNSLAAGQEGELSFSLKIKDKLPINSFSDKNFTVKTTAIIDSANVPLALLGAKLTGQNDLIVKVNSRAALSAKVFYFDNLMPNSGPLPPLVGQQTTYTVHWNVLNDSNDLLETRIEAFLPPYMRWLGKVSPANEDIKYDAQTGKIIWNIGKLNSATGVLLPVKTAAFQIGLTPAPNQVGQTVNLIGESVLNAKDSFTDAQYQIKANGVGSNLPDDKQMTWQMGTIGN